MSCTINFKSTPPSLDSRVEFSGQSRSKQMTSAISNASYPSGDRLRLPASRRCRNVLHSLIQVSPSPACSPRGTDEPLRSLALHCQRSCPQARVRGPNERLAATRKRRLLKQAQKKSQRNPRAGAKDHMHIMPRAKPPPHFAGSSGSAFEVEMRLCGSGFCHGSADQ